MRLKEFAPDLLTALGKGVVASAAGVGAAGKSIDDKTSSDDKPTSTDTTNKQSSGQGLDPNKKSTPGLDPNKTSGVGLKMPANGLPTNGRITGPYGRMVTGPQGNKVKHPGVDIGAPKGSPVVAPADGTIKLVYPNHKVAGNFIELITTAGERHRFLHLSKMDVKAGDQVKKGQQLGAVGSTGFSTGPHLHWEKYAANGKQQDPLA